jgi:hypothetical protein
VASQQPAASTAPAAYGDREIGPPPHPGFRGKHARPPLVKLGTPGSHADPGPALPASRGQNRPAGTGTHAQPEPVRLGTTSVVRLERALAHWWLQIRCQHPQSATGHAKSANNRPGKDCQGKFESANGTRASEHRSNQRIASRPQPADQRRNPTTPRPPGAPRKSGTAVC